MTCRPAVLCLTVLLLGVATFTGCAAPVPQDLTPSASRVPGLPGQLLPTPLLLVGEQHDAPEHQVLQRDLVLQLAARSQLAALVMEMVDQGLHTSGLPADASEAEVRQALQWTGDQRGWPWASYGPVVMTAVRAGIPVIGGNLPARAMRAAMDDPALEQHLDADTLRQQQDNIREGHCGLLPDSRIAPMTRIQIARDLSMARSAKAALKPGQTVLLVAGNQHVRRDLGVPLHLGDGVAYRVVMAMADSSDGTQATAPADVADQIWRTPPRTPRDYCAEMKKQMGR